jgi:hypothetical protein
MTETNQQAYNRGEDAGRIAQRLDGYDEHFNVINGSIAASALAMREMALQIQRLTDQSIADSKERKQVAEAVEKSRRETAEAVESERAVRADRSTTAWTPFARIFAVVAFVAGVLAIIGWLRK